MHDSLLEKLAEGLTALPLELNASVQNQLIDFLHLLVKWNRAYNLTAVRQPEQMVTRHLLDSLVIGPYLQGPRILDVGTGAGLPGIPLALAYPDCHFTLLDSNGKKIRFVTQAVAELGLANVDVVQSRVEAFQPASRFDTITARAYASIEELVSQTTHLLADGGQYLIMKGAYPVAEVEAMPTGYRLEAIHQLNVPKLDAERHLLIVRTEP
ncbi:MAG: 16S rRNA (guanine(527)-N(7))-methyltransferase RsmG [Gammaproteobacteria bacterium]|nr:16S rRNA (guanine(527)-N(7))-methyltransferase RsmG [Gammaproteobacteria bacterium]